ncbi:hypothetical protein GCM10027160_39940 [Streptomyces calidiresistens]|uniref:Lipoprotein n=1 Tax=Streptomyces calidiresistens TaxID=1485586 RepID=A0A7W3XVW3_9ACTN|nr:hypothetical protein [Streptomyces calidiresistens]MBB0229239.1 hypothetical protein [Streptomyces calidiresistens]
MKRRLAGSAVAGLVAASLLVTACSSDADGGDDGAAAPIEGADGAGEASGEPEPEEPTGDPTPEDDGIDRPEIRVADDLELIFEEPGTDDPVERAIILDSQRQFEAVFAQMTTQDVENSAVGFYTAGNALLEDGEALAEIMAENGSSAGVMRFYNYEVKNLEENSAVVEYCRDFSEVYDTDFETGEVVEEADPTATPTHYVTRVEINGIGVWQTHEKFAEAGDVKCS